MKGSQSLKKEKKQQKKVNKKRSYEFDLQLILVPLILLIILAIISLINIHVLQDIERNKLAESDSIAKVNPYPFVKSVSMPTISAKAAIIADADSQVILFSKNPQLRFSMASTTKIMTALTALDYYKDDSVLTVNTPGTEGSRIGLQQGEKLYFKDLLYAMLLPSANDAALVIAENYPGDKEEFVRKMNEKAQSLHLSQTHFSDPTGLDDDGNYTTVVDMAHLASYAIKNKKFTEITATKQKTIATINTSKQYTFYNLNKLLGENGVTGIKTGTTEGAGEVLVTSTVENNHTFIIVVMSSEDRFVDTKTLLTFISQNVEFIIPGIPLANY